MRKTKKNISKKHYRFYYHSILKDGDEVPILLDVLFATSPYSKTIECEINSEILINNGENLLVKTPSIEALLGDKLTAFAPHTVGIQFFNEDFSNDKRLEVIKQLIDVSSLFSLAKDFNEVRNNYISVCKEELEFRELTLDYKECLLDSFNAALSIISRGYFY